MKPAYRILNIQLLISVLCAVSGCAWGPWPKPVEKLTDAQRPVVSEARATAIVELRNLKIGKNGTVTGWVVNKSGHPVRNVRVLVRHVWLWRNERHPGRNNPGRSAYYSVNTEVPAGGSAPFAYRPKPPLSSRRDGWFQTTAEVVGFVEVGAPGQPATATEANPSIWKSLKWPKWPGKLWPSAEK